MQPAMEMVLYSYLTSKDIVERIQSKLSAWKKSTIFLQSEESLFLLVEVVMANGEIISMVMANGEIISMAP
jgi:hypothetical protein